MKRQPNEDQLRVVEDLDNNIILFASAGTGKTFTVAKRVSHILQTQKATAQEILCLTFTTKACEEMREDISRYVGKAAKEVAIHTIHGFCYRLMREENRRNNDKYSEAIVCDEVDAEELIGSILSSQYALWEGDSDPKAEESALSDKQFALCAKKGALRNFISALKHVREEKGFYTDDEIDDYQQAFHFLSTQRTAQYAQLLTLSSGRGGQVRDEQFDLAMRKHAGKLAFTYDNHLKQSNRVDYDDLILFACRTLKQAEPCMRWATRYRYIIVDEMQDTSLLEYEVLTKIFGQNKVMMCGDFFQSIYGWRGAKPEIVLEDFQKRYHAKTYTLAHNYRSTKTLTGATFGYLRHTYPTLLGRYCPQSITVQSEAEGEKILCIGFDNRREEGYQIYKYIRRHREASHTPICVIARSNFYISALARTFEECNQQYPIEERVPFFTAEENQQFYRTPIVKDALAMMKLLLNKTDRISMERITEKYVRMVGEKTIEWLRTQNPIGVSIVSFLEKQTHEQLDPYHVLIDAFQNEEIVVYDTETTGLDLDRDEMVQLAAIRIDKTGKIVETFEKMIIPTVDIGEGAYVTHGFNLAYIRAHGGVTPKEALEEFSRFVKGKVLVGHNSFRFDAPLLRRQLKDNKLPPLEIKGEYDTLTIAKQFHERLPDFRLETLCKKYGIVNEAAHNAYGDIVATGKALCRMITEDVLPTTLERRNVCAKHKDKFAKLYLFLSSLQGKMDSPFAVLSAIIDGMGMYEKCRTDAERRALNDLVAIFKTSGNQDTETFLRKFVSEADLSGSRTDLLIEKEGRIPLLTVHQAKGCEFDTVIVAGADNRNFPNYYAKNEKEEEGEEKVFYVAISRAKKKLILTRARHNGRERLNPSPYVEKIPEEYLWKNERWDGWFE